MADLRARTPYQYRTDPSVPDLQDDRPIAMMDGACALCSRGAHIISRLDRDRVFRICTVQSATGTALVRHYGLEPDDPETCLLQENGQAWSGMDAIIRIGERLDGIGRIASTYHLVPKPVRDWLYRRIARNRFRFGHTFMSAVADPELRLRLMI